MRGPARRVRGQGAFPSFSGAFVGVASAACCLLELDEVIKVQTQARDKTMDLKKKEAEDIFNK